MGFCGVMLMVVFWEVWWLWWICGRESAEEVVVVMVFGRDVEKRERDAEMRLFFFYFNKVFLCF